MGKTKPKNCFIIWTVGTSCDVRSVFETADDAFAVKELLASQGFEVKDEVWYGHKHNGGFDGCLVVMMREGGFDE